MSRNFLLAAALVFNVACAKTSRQKQSAAATPRPTYAGTPVSAPPPVPPNTPKETGSGSTGDFNYTFEKTGDTAVVNFTPKLPLVQEIIEGAARQVILEVYGEEMEGFPRSVEWNYKDRKTAAMLTGEGHDYVFLHQTDERKEVPTLIFWRVPKDSVKMK